jgi:glutaredoxin
VAVIAEDYVFQERSMQRAFIMMAILIGTASAPLAASQLYQWKGADGRTVYSDQPPPTSIRNAQQKAFKGSVIEVGEPYAARTAREKHPVTLYTSACGAPCDQARQLLNERGVPYCSKDLQASEDARNELQKLTGKLNVPILLVGSDKLEGFAAGPWQAALDRAGYPKSTPGRKPAPAAAAAAPAPAQ